MLDNLSAKLQKVLRDLKGEGRVTEQHVDVSLREIRMALLEADVHFKVVKDFVSRIREQALGQDVLRSLTPGQQVVKIVRDELIELLGREQESIRSAKVPPTVILMVGLQGSGKTTTTAKLGSWLRRSGRRPLMVSCDVYRPAAIDQLAVLGRSLNIPVYEEEAVNTAVGRAKAALTFARNGGFDHLLIDTAGRLHIDEALMDELDEMRQVAAPEEILLVADAMTGQDAVNSAGQFDRRLGLSGVILTKLDGDARGGAALSIRTVTGKPIKFVGTGEKSDALEVFHPERMANRILGMGDVLGLIERAEQTVDEENARQMIGKLKRNEFSLEDFRQQLRQVRSLGPLEQVMEMLPRIGPFRGLDQIRVDEKELINVEVVINSMTHEERNNYKLLNGSRRKRIAAGCGRPVSEVNRVIKQYVEARKMMKQLSKGFLGKQLAKISFSN